MEFSRFLDFSPRDKQKKNVYGNAIQFFAILASQNFPILYKQPKNVLFIFLNFHFSSKNSKFFSGTLFIQFCQSIIVEILIVGQSLLLNHNSKPNPNWYTLCSPILNALTPPQSSLPVRLLSIDHLSYLRDSIKG